MKANSKWMLGLLAALAMIFFTVPAFAQTSDPPSQNNALNVKVLEADSDNDAQTNYSYYVGEKNAKALKVVASGGAGGYSYQWYKGGTALSGAAADTLSFDAIKEEDAGEYQCSVSDGEGTVEQTEKITINVHKTPTLKINGAAGNPSYFVDPKSPVANGGHLRVNSTEMGNALTLTADVTECNPTWIKWYKGDTDHEITEAAGQKSYTIPAGQMQNDDQYIVRANFEGDGLTGNLKYTVVIKEMSGQLAGGMMKSGDGGQTITGNTQYTITLPEGEIFKKQDSGKVSLADLSAQYDVSIEPELDEAMLDVTVTQAADSTPATMTINFDSIGLQQTPVVAPMEVVVQTASGKTVNLPVSDDIGFEIKLAPTSDKLHMITPDPKTVSYTGQPVAASVAPLDQYTKGFGNIDKIRYATENDVTKATDEVPTDVGQYYVFCDVSEGEQYSAAQGVYVDTFTIQNPVIYLRAHVQNYGWDKKLTPLEVGKTAEIGTTARALRLEAVDVIVPDNYRVAGYAHLENLGDTSVKEVPDPDYDVPNGYVVYRFGTTGQARRLEALCMEVRNYSGNFVKGLTYAVHLQNYSWQGYVRNGSFAGTRGICLRVEAIRFVYNDDEN